MTRSPDERGRRENNYEKSEDDLARNFDALQSDHWRFIKSHALIALGTVNIIIKFANFLKTKLP